MKNHTKRLLQTSDGFLHRDLTDGYNTEPGEINYRFTKNPHFAAEFPTDTTVPYGLGVPTETPLDTAQECADYLSGTLVNVEIRPDNTWRIQSIDDSTDHAA